MNKYILIIGLFAFGLIGLASKSQAGSVYDGWNYYELATASASIKGPLRIKSVVASTPSAAGVWAVIIETNVVQNATFAQFTSSSKRSPALVLSTAPAVSNGYGPQQNELINYGEDGLHVGTTAFFFISTPSSGEANKLGILFKK